MIRFLMLPLILLFIGCSSDDTSVNWQNEGETSSIGNGDRNGFITKAVTATCFTSLTASVSVDVSNGIGNPEVLFTSSPSGTVSATAKFNVRVEVQPLSNCDDMNSATGNLLTFGPSGTVQNVIASPPVVRVMPSSMPFCYKWRFVFDGISDAKRTPICTSTSQWYESPVF